MRDVPSTEAYSYDVFGRMIAKAECQYDGGAHFFLDCKARTVYFDYDGLSQQILATRVAPYSYDEELNWIEEGDDYLWTFVHGPTGTVIQTDERSENDPEDGPSHVMMPDVHGGRRLSLVRIAEDRRSRRTDPRFDVGRYEVASGGADDYRLGPVTE